jgi:hypothetical protein
MKLSQQNVNIVSNTRTNLNGRNNLISEKTGIFNEKIK